MKKKLTPEEMIEEIMNEFDFERVHIAMNVLNWRWGIGSDFIIPSQDLIKEEARRLLENVVELTTPYSGSVKGPFSIATGGLKATAWKSKKGNITNLELGFILATWDSVRSDKHL